MSEATYPKASKASKPPARPVDDYEDYDEEDEIIEHDVEPYYEDEQEPGTGLLASPGRAMALGVAGLALLVVFSAIIWLMSTREPQAPTLLSTNEAGVPTILGLAQTSEAQAPNKGALAPDFIWKEGNDQTLQLSSFRGSKPIFMNFWGTWCPPCRAEMPAMETFYMQHKDEIQIIGVSMYPRDDPTQVLNFVKNANYSWKFVHDGDYRIAEKYQVASVPSSYFIDRSGVIQAVHIGAMNNQQMETYFQQVR
ncbi:MAG: TlpA disulfide reductase family protein [Chloroflexota bacterium]